MHLYDFECGMRCREEWRAERKWTLHPTASKSGHFAVLNGLDDFDSMLGAFCASLRPPWISGLGLDLDWIREEGAVVSPSLSDLGVSGRHSASVGEGGWPVLSFELPKALFSSLMPTRFRKLSTAQYSIA